MALWLTVVIALTCLGGLAAPGPVPHSRALKELIEELVNITKNQASLCNGSMVWKVNMTAGKYCAALDSLTNVSDCSAIGKTQRLLKLLCPVKASRVDSSERIRDTKVEVTQLIKDLLKHLREIFRHGELN
ncbi:Interleukin-13 [Manis pentadactyla]|nr:Interleukin-13 [Manis pentadactyla]